MPVISEEEDGHDQIFHTDFSELLDLPESTFPGSYDVLAASTAAADALSQSCPAHPETLNCLCNGFMGDWDLSEIAADPYVGLEEPDYAKFENWIPQFVRPEKPCDYCRARRLACYITRGEHGCTSCNVLFRQCSLITDKATGADKPPAATLLDTLHVVDEDTAREQGAAVGIRSLRSKAGASGARLDSDGPTSSKRNGIRFPRHAVKILRDWLDAHADNPYPTEEEKVELEQRTELKPAQIANWLANARRRRKVTEKVRPRLCTSPSLRASTPAIDIPATDKPWDELNPFERWKKSPPENEPALMTDIANAVANSDLPDDQVSTSPSSLGRKKHRSSAGSGFSNPRPASTTSFETRQTSSLSASTSAKYSQHSSQSHGSFGSFSSGLAGKKDRRRRRRPAPVTLRKPGDEKKRIFQCTFCTDTFKSKYDWTRHEKSLHLSLEKWICAPLGPVITDPVSGNKRCVYCDEQNPGDDHVENHNYKQCEEKGLDARTFYRKDHLRQHLRLMHNCEMTPFMDNWKSVAVNINSRCGFCAKRFTVWQERVDHLTAHFKAGVRMAEWKGCRGLDPGVAAQVTNAMPPYLIGIESVSPNPFSASNKATWRQATPSEFGLIAPDLGNISLETVQDQIPAPQLDNTGTPNKATCWEILTVRLGRYANKMSAQGVVLTDDMLQSESRRILYEEDDPWHQTAADNPEWLDLFKKAHGLDFIPNAVGGQGDNVPEDLETYGDLGLRIPFSVQLQAFNQSQAPEQLCHFGALDGDDRKMGQNQSTVDSQRIWRILAKEGVLHDANGKCKHTECEDNVFKTNVISSDTAAEPKRYRWCTYDLPPQQVKEIADAKKALTTSTTRMMNSASPDSIERAARANHLSQTVDLLHQLESQPAGYDSEEAAARAKAQALTALTHAECCGGMVENCRWNDPTKKSYLQRHRYQLPAHRAHQFATTTGPWTDSGNMAPVISTASIDMGPHITSTGAMMEFLGPDLGATLPFSTDAATSTIPISSEFNWTTPTSAADEAAMMDDVDRLIAETTPPENQVQLFEDKFSSITTSAEMSNVMAMDEMNFDMEMDFDGVFDMPMDETFGLQS